MTNEQKDPNGIGAHDGGAKLDAGKNRISLLFMQYFPNAIDAITSISEFGARKYSPGGWKKVPDGYQRYTDAMGRHYLADCKGEIFDDETKLPHDFQIAWNALARIECAMMEGKYGTKLSKPDAEVFVKERFNEDDTIKLTGNEDMSVAELVSSHVEDMIHSENEINSCPDCGSKEGYKSILGNWVCEQCQSKAEAEIILTDEDDEIPF